MPSTLNLLCIAYRCDPSELKNCNTTSTASLLVDFIDTFYSINLRQHLSFRIITACEITVNELAKCVKQLQMNEPEWVSALWALIVATQTSLKWPSVTGCDNFVWRPNRHIQIIAGWCDRKTFKSLDAAILGQIHAISHKMTHWFAT